MHTGEITLRLLFDPDCPNAGPALELAEAVVREFGSGIRLEASDPDDAHSWASTCGYGSPSFLVNGLDVAAVRDQASAGMSRNCRVYIRKDGSLAGLVDRESLRAAIARAACP